MSTEPTRDGGMVELNFRVELDPEDPRVVVVTLGDQKARVTFDTEEDARRADRICTQVLLMFTTIVVTCRGRIVEGPNVWQPGEKPPECWREGRTGAARQDMDGSAHADEPIRRRNCINWSGDHCARTKGIFCPVKCPDYWPYKDEEGGDHA